MNQSLIRTMTDRTMAPQIKICSAIATLPLLRSGSANKGSAIAWVYLRSLSEAASEPETSLRLRKYKFAPPSLEFTWGAWAKLLANLRLRSGSPDKNSRRHRYAAAFGGSFAQAPQIKPSSAKYISKHWKFFLLPRVGWVGFIARRKQSQSDKKK